MPSPWPPSLRRPLPTPRRPRSTWSWSFTDEEYGAFRDACSGVYEKYQSIIGDEFYNYVLGLVDAGPQVNAKGGRSAAPAPVLKMRRNI